MDINVYGDAVVSITCQMSRKATDSDNVVMVWGGISIDGRTVLVVRGNLTAAGYKKQILL